MYNKDKASVVQSEATGKWSATVVAQGKDVPLGEYDDDVQAIHACDTFYFTFGKYLTCSSN